MAETTKPRKSPLATILLIVTIIGATAFWYYALYAPIDFEMAEESDSFALLTANTNATELVIDIDADIGEFSIDLLPEGSNNSVNADWTYTYLIDPQQSPNPAINISVTEVTVGNVLTISIFIDQDEAVDAFHIVNLEFSLAFANNFTLVDIIGDFSAASVIMDLDGGNFGDIYLDSAAGSYDLTFTNCNFLGDLVFQTEVGSIELEWEDNIVSNTTLVDLNTNVGSIAVDWTQRVSLTANVEINLATDTGSIEFDALIKNSSAKFDIVWDTSVGSSDIDYENGESVGEDHYQTLNYESLLIPTIFLDASASVGAVDITIDTYF
ncbi:MAG: hypothetical protein E4G98_06365 [Promethearchaeota archaeon]|nr:MAG: hypothetical protein E4G98_06365 [Candidatus Lokiarchaeota archaeon]